MSITQMPVRRQHIISVTFDPDGKEVVIVPLGRNSYGDASAQIFREDYDLLLSLGLSRSWTRWPSGYVIAPAHRARGSHVGVARVLLDAQAGENIRYLDGNPL